MKNDNRSDELVNQNLTEDIMEPIRLSRDSYMAKNTVAKSSEDYVKTGKIGDRSPTSSSA